MVQVNLISRKRKLERNKGWILYVLAGFFALFVLYFLGSAIYVTLRLSMTNRDIAQVEEETVQISREISANDELLVSFVLSKGILGRIDTLVKDKFDYKDYLDQIVSFMPEDVILRNVDFSVRGWIAVTASMPSAFSIAQLENNLSSPARLGASRFASVFAEEVSKSRAGEYIAQLQFEIKPNGR